MANLLVENFRRVHPDTFTDKSDNWVYESLKDPDNLKKFFPKFKTLSDREALNLVKKDIDPSLNVEKIINERIRRLSRREKAQRKLTPQKPEAEKKKIINYNKLGTALDLDLKTREITDENIPELDDVVDTFYNLSREELTAEEFAELVSDPELQKKSKDEELKVRKFLDIERRKAGGLVKALLKRAPRPAERSAKELTSDVISTKKANREYISSGQAKKDFEDQRDQEIYLKLSKRPDIDSKFRKDFWFNRKGKEGYWQDVGKTMASSLFEGASGIDFGSIIDVDPEAGISVTGVNPNKDVYGAWHFLGNTIGFIASLYAGQKLVSAPTVAIARGFPILSRLNPKLLTWLLGATREGLAWGITESTKEALGQAYKQDEIDWGKVSRRGLKNAGLGFLLKGLPIKKALPRHLSATALTGGWSTFWALKEDGNLDTSDIIEIMSMMAVANLSTLSWKSADKSLYNAFKDNKLENTIKGRINQMLTKGKPLSSQAKKDLHEIVINGGFSRDRSVKFSNPAEAILIPFFGERYNKLGPEGKQAMAKLVMGRLNRFIKQGRGAKAVQDVMDDVGKLFNSYDKLTDNRVLIKNFFDVFLRKLKSTKNITGSIKETRKLVNEFANANKLRIDKLTMDDLEKRVVRNLASLIKKSKFKTLKSLINKNTKAVESSVRSTFSGLSRELLGKIKTLKGFEKISTSATYKTLIARQQSMESTLKTFVNNLDISKASKKRMTDSYINRSKKVIGKLKQAEEQVEAGFKDIVEPGLFTPFEFINLQSVSKTRGFKKAYDTASQRLFEGINTFKQLDKSLQKGVLSNEFLGAWAKGKGIFKNNRTIQDTSELKKILPFFDDESLNEIKNVINSLADDVRIHEKGIKDIGLLGTTLTPVDHSNKALGLTYVSKVQTLAMKEKELEFVAKNAIMNNQVWKPLKETSRKLGISYEGSKNRIRLALDGKLALDVVRKADKTGKWTRNVPMMKHEYQVYKFLRGETESIYKRINKLRARAGLNPVLHQDEYVFHIIKPEILNQYYSKGVVPAELSLLLRNKPQGTQFLRTAQHRLSDFIEENLVTDLEKLMRGMYAVDLNWIATQKALSRLAPVKVAVTKSGKYSANVVEFLNKQINNWKRLPSSLDERVNATLERVIAQPLRAMGFKVGIRPIRELADTFSSVAHLSALGGRLKFAVRNIGGQGLFANQALYGTRATAFGVVNSGSKFAKKIFEQIDEYLVRFPIPGVEKNFQKKFMQSLYKTVYAPVTVSDKINVKISILSSFYRSLRIFGFKGNIKKALINNTVPQDILKKSIDRASKDFVNTQWSYLRHNLPMIMQGDTGRIAFMFSSWTLNNWFRRMPELMTRAFKGVDSLGNKLPWQDQIALYRHMLQGGITFGLGATGLKFIWDLWKGQAITKPLPATPMLNSMWDFTHAIWYSTELGGADKRRAIQHWYRLKNQTKLLVPMYYAFDDWYKVLSGQEPLSHLFKYKYKSLRNNKLKSDKAITGEHLRMVQDEIKGLGQWEASQKDKQDLLKKLKKERQDLVNQLRVTGGN